MTLEGSLNPIMEKIPHQATYGPDAILQIAIPSNYGNISSDELLMLVTHAGSKGWTDDKIDIVHKSGYIECDKCGNKLHVHIARKDAVFCMSCGHSLNHNLNETEINVSE